MSRPHSEFVGDILLVEDEASHAELIHRAFENAGLPFEVTYCERIEDARRLLDGHAFKLVISDLRLPDGRGLELIAHGSEGARVPVMLMTAHGTQDIAVEAMRAGAADYVVKSPEAFVELPYTAQRALRQHWLEQLTDEAKQATIASERRFRAVFEETTLGMLLLRTDGGGIVHANRSWLADVGLELEQAKEVSLQALMLDSDPEEERRLFEELLAGKIRSFDIERRIRGSGGRELTQRTKLSLLPPLPESELLLLAVVEDVTEQRAIERKLREQDAQLRQAQRMEAIGSLAGGVAHDFNNLLAVTMMFGQAILDDLPPDSPLCEDAQVIVDTATRGSDLTRQLLAFGRRQQLAPVPLRPAAQMGKMLQMLTRLLGTDVELELHTANNAGQVLADPGQLEQVMMNLVLNARDAMPHGGRIEIRIGDRTVPPGGCSEWPGAPAGDYVMVTVTDSGEGMDKSLVSRVFEPFFTTKKEGKGTGLGLATVYGIVKQSGGHVFLESEIGRGTTFAVFLPRLPYTASRPVLATASSTPAVEDRVILVVEDDPEVRQGLTRILRRHGCRVFEASNPGEAILLVEQRVEPFDLLITDLVMPRMSGAALARRLHKRWPALPVIFVSGDQGRHSLLNTKEDWIFLLKPFKEKELLNAMERTLGGSGEVRSCTTGPDGSQTGER